MTRELLADFSELQNETEMENLLTIWKSQISTSSKPDVHSFAEGAPFPLPQ